ncbi:MAG TPA: FadR/GntR family transcriptional regulator [Chloroflexota bacterium]|jgi:DNA-binding FadR family transcriptional regulator|nr:FadR/GntR family transcriptional regulator [Chloroflexota bacterium]
MPTTWLASRPTRLSVVVITILVDRIVSGEYPPGSLLPPEPLLCESFGVSRSVVREAAKALEEKGLARARQGHGTTINPPDEWNLLDPVVLDAAVRHDDTLGTLDDVVEARVALECQMVRAAARRMTRTDLEELARLLTELEADVKVPERYHETDTRYHDLIHRCSGNRLGRSIIRSIHPFARASSRYSPPMDEEDLRQSQLQHASIYERLADRDPEGAAAAMEGHITSSWAARKEKARRYLAEHEPSPVTASATRGREPEALPASYRVE